MNKLEAWLDLSETALGFVCVVILAIMFVLGVSEVFCRYVLERSLSFPSELIRYLFVWSVSLGSAIAVRKNSHAAIELFVNWLPDAIRKWALVAGFVISGIFFVILAVKGFELVHRVYPQNSPAMRISMSYAYAAIPVGAVFMVIYTLELIMAQIFSRSRI